MRQSSLEQIERRAAEECGATCFRDAIDILDGEIAKFPPRGREVFGDQTEKRFGRDRLKRLVPFVQRDDIHDVYRL